jgi:hypothetical protein
MTDDVQPQPDRDAIVAFRETHAEALGERSHPEHQRRLGELTALHEGRQPAADPIADYRKEYAEALNSRSHPLHAKAVEGLTALFEARHAGTEGGDGKPAADAEAWRDNPDLPLPESEIAREIGINSKFASEVLAIDGLEGWDRETAAMATAAMAKAGLDLPQVQSVRHAFIEAAQSGFSPEVTARNEQFVTERLQERFGPQGYQDAIKAIRRVVDESGGAPLRRFLDETGLSVSPRIVYAILRTAHLRGYLDMSKEGD